MDLRIRQLSIQLGAKLDNKHLKCVTKFFDKNAMKKHMLTSQTESYKAEIKTSHLTQTFMELQSLFNVRELHQKIFIKKIKATTLTTTTRIVRKER